LVGPVMADASMADALAGRFIADGDLTILPLDGITPLRLENYPYLTPNGDSPRQSNLGAEFGHLDTREQVLACVDMAKRAGLDFLVLDHTRPDIDVPVVRVTVPGLRHFYRRF